MKVREIEERLTNIYACRKRPGACFPEVVPKDFDALLAVLEIIEKARIIQALVAPE